MEAMREAWTDERLDDLTHREMRSEFQAVRSEMRSEIASVRAEMVRSEAAAMYRTLLRVILGGFALMLAGFATTIVTVLTQN